MDSHAVSYTTRPRRIFSKTYQDLASCRPNGHTSTSRPSYIMEETIKHRALRPSTPPHVGIIGAGVAGLRCADILLQNGFQVTILEGRDRVGGRVHQTYIPNTNHLVDIGANWIHGTDHNPILDLATKTKTPTYSWGEDFNVFTEDGTYMSAEEGSEYNELVWSIIIDAFKHSNEYGDSLPPSQSLYDFFLDRVKVSIPETEKDYEKRRKVVLQMSEMWGAFVGRTIKQQSLKFFWLEETIEGENLFCAGTYQKILALIANPALDKATIKFLTTVSKISAPREADGSVVVTTDKNETFQFDEIVVTAPLGWLKKNQGAFTPSLPSRLASAIESIGYGCLEKVYISFPRAFWLSTAQGKTPSRHSQPNHTAIEPEFSGFSQFLSPKYSPLNSKHWIQEVLELSTLPGTCAKPTLLFYIFGDQSRALTADLRSLPPSKERHTLLVNFFHPYFSRLPNYSESNPDCIPVSSYATEWLNDDLAGNGSYSNFPTGLEQGDKDIEVMREGMPGRGIWLAGEHTSPFVASGTVTGAYWSGEGVAKRIAEAYGLAVDAGVESFAPSDHGVGPSGLKGKSGQDMNGRASAESALEG